MGDTGAAMKSKVKFDIEDSRFKYSLEIKKVYDKMTSKLLDLKGPLWTLVQLSDSHFENKKHIQTSNIHFIVRS